MTFHKISLSCQIPGLNKIYDQYFMGLTDGTFVEVGGNDGYSWSNTWGLAEEGWKGLYFEPDGALVERCRKVHARNNVTILQTCVGEFDGLTKLYQGQSLTTSPQVAQNNTFFYGNSPDKFIISKVVSLNTSLKEQGIKHNFDLLVIDVDGDEIGVLKGIDLDLWAPRMVIVETNKTHPIPEWHFNYDGIDSILSQYYDEIYSDHINSIYLRNEKRKVRTMPNLFESKRDAILKYAGGYGCKLFVETGTGGGDMLSAVYPYFKQAYSIELSKELYRGAVARFRRAETIHLFQGDSGEVIHKVIPLLKEPALIFLDAHYSGGHSVRGSLETPIVKELEALLFEPRFPHVILIDDLKDFTANASYPKPDKLKAFVADIRKDLSFDILSEGGGMIRIVKASRKFNPERKAIQLVPAVVEGGLEPQAASEKAEEKTATYKFARPPMLYGPFRHGEKE